MTVEEAITRQARIDRFSLILEYCPGDMTRYLIQVTQFEAHSEASRILDGVWPNECMVFTWLNGSGHAAHHSIVLMLNDNYLAPSYVAGKMGVNEATLRALLPLFSHFTKRAIPDNYKLDYKRRDEE